MLDNARFTVYPNPTTSVIRAEWQMEDGDFAPIKEVRLVGLDGKPVQIISAPTLPLDIDRSGREQKTAYMIYKTLLYSTLSY
jgi:hypothetical protein